MTNTGLDVFDTTIEKSNLILKEIEAQFGWEGRRNQSYLALRSVLHALRDRLPIDEAVNFSAQLPLLIKGVFFDGWSTEKVPIKMNRPQFEQYVSKQFKFDTGEGIDEVIRVVLNSVFDNIDPAEADKIINSLPKDINNLLC